MAGDDVNVIYSDAGLNRKGITAEVVTGDYDPGNLVEIDRAIRHAPWVLRYLKKKANECLGLIEKGHDFHLIVSEGGVGRARVYVAPANDAGIHLELADSVLLKAAASMLGR